ncbi:MAG: CRISPR-associated endoribonuclease Cas6 [Clostridium sp.]|mgnify:FL=1|nr:CRISPR-associated endoribonuclease Cas6 [Clostridium sp.]
MHSEHEIIFKDTVHFEVRSVDPNFVYQLGSVLCPSSQINLFENTLEILDSRIEDYSPNTCCAKISMLSPITVFETERSGYRRFIAPDESLFYTAVVNNALRKWQSYFNTPAPTDFSFEPALPPAELIQNHRIVSRFKRSTIVSYGGSYVLRGNGKLINFLYDAGLGSKNSQGLGMFNIESFPDL